MKRLARTLAALGFLLLVGAAPARSALLTTYPLPPSLSWADKIVAGPDGAMWLTQDALNPASGHQYFLGRITTTGVVSTRALPPGSPPLSLATTPDGGLVYATGTASGAKLGRVSADAIGELALPGLRSAIDVATGPDGALWFIATDLRDQYRIGRVAADGRVVSFPVPGVDDVKNIVAGPAATLWIGVNGGVARIDASGRLRRFRLPLDDLAAPDDVAAGPDGTLWIADSACICIVRMSRTGRVRKFLLPGDLPGAVAVGSDGAIWYSGLDGIGRMTPTGEVTTFAVPDLAGDLASGPDGALWFSMVHLSLLAPKDPSHGSSTVGRIDVPGSADRFLVVRLASGRRRGPAGQMLRIRFTTTRRAAGTLKLLRGETVVGTTRLRAGATTASVRLPRRPGSYRVRVQLRLPAQAASDEARVQVTVARG